MRPFLKLVLGTYTRYRISGGSRNLERGGAQMRVWQGVGQSRPGEGAGGGHPSRPARGSGGAL